MQRNNLRLALQRSGRLADGSQSLLTKCGVKVSASKNQLLVQDHDFGIDFIFARDDDIPGLVEKGVCDLGIIGGNLMEEYCGQENTPGDNLEVVMPLGFAKCKLSLAVPKDKFYTISQIKQDEERGVTCINDTRATSDEVMFKSEKLYLEGRIIATSYPNTIKKFLAKNNVRAEVVVMHGSVELAPQMGIADVICDLVSSGATLKENGLKEWLKVTDSEAILIANKSAMKDEAKQTLLQRLLLRINGILKADQNKYVMMHIERDKLPLLAEILPGSESPTVIDLPGKPGRVAAHVVSREEIFWETIEKLKAIGAGSILVLPIEKMIS